MLTYFFYSSTHQQPQWWGFCLWLWQDSPENTLDAFMDKQWEAVQTLLWVQVPQHCPGNCNTMYVLLQEESISGGEELLKGFV